MKNTNIRASSFEGTAKYQPDNYLENSSIITIFDGDLPPYEVNLKHFKKTYVTFGRDETNDIFLTSNYVSHKHGAFYYRDGNIYVEDRESLNGLVLNGKVFLKADQFSELIIAIVLIQKEC